MMAARGDFTIITEPFSDAYYFGPERISDRFGDNPETPPVGFDNALANILAAAQRAPVFFKDMACHVRQHLSREFLSHFTNAVLLRDPRLSLVSLYKRMPDFTLDEAGFEALNELVELLDEMEASPFVMDGETLRANPERVCRDFCDAVGIPFKLDALQWERGGEKHWNRWQEWFDGASDSTQFKAPEVQFDEETLAIPYMQQALERCTPCYETLCSKMAKSGKC